MIGSNIPSAELAVNLRDMLELMQLAADPKKAKAVLEKIDEAHAEIASKLAEIDAREKAAAALEAQAQTSVDKATQATNKALTEQGNTAEMKALLRKDEEELKAYKATVDAQAAEQALRAAELEQREAAVQARLEKGLEELASKSAALDAKLAEVEAAKADVAAQSAELKDKLASLRKQIKSLAE